MSKHLKADTTIAIGALFAFLSVAAGAFGAHALKETLTAYQLGVFDTAVQYQMMHALGLILIGILKHQRPEHKLDSAALLMLAGIIVFSGSLYALSLSGIQWLGAITPLGGVCFLLSWLVLCLSFIRTRQD